MRDPVLIEKINPVLAMSPSLKVSAPSSALELTFSTLNPQPVPRRAPNPRLNAFRTRRASVRRRSRPCVKSWSRPCLIYRNSSACGCGPGTPGRRRFDCDPNIIFKVTQILQRHSRCSFWNKWVFQARWDIPTQLDVEPHGERRSLHNSDWTPATKRKLFRLYRRLRSPRPGANEEIGAADSPALAGLANPMDEDRPFTGTVNVDGIFGAGAPCRLLRCRVSVPRAFPTPTRSKPLPFNVLQPFRLQLLRRLLLVSPPDCSPSHSPPRRCRLPAAEQRDCLSNTRQL